MSPTFKPEDLVCKACGYMAADFEELRQHNNAEHTYSRKKHVDLSRLELASRLEVVEALEKFGRSSDEVREHHESVPFDHVIRAETVSPTRVRLFISDGPDPKSQKRGPNLKKLGRKLWDR